MRKIFTTFVACAAVIGFTACGSSEEKNDQPETPEEDGVVNDSTAVVENESGITITPLTDSPKFAEAKLSVASPGYDENALVFEDENGDEASYATEDLTIDFDVEGYQLGEQTSDAEGKGLSNSGKGQHIHLILNNGPYRAVYDPKGVKFEGEKALEDGSYVMLAFLSRSYHESVKSPGAAVLHTFTVGEGGEASNFDVYGQHMFYSRPKGGVTLKGDDTKKVILDFYLWKTELSEGGNYVEATIGEYTQKLTQWTPYVIEGLPMGDHTLKLELKDAEGNVIEGPYNSVERTFTLAEADPAE